MLISMSENSSLGASLSSRLGGDIHQCCSVGHHLQFGINSLAHKRLISHKGTIEKSQRHLPLNKPPVTVRHLLTRLFVGCLNGQTSSCCGLAPYQGGSDKTRQG